MILWTHYAVSLTRYAQFWFRLATLLHVTPKKIKAYVGCHLNELSPTADAWSTLRFIRRTAVELVNHDKEVRISWVNDDSMIYIDPANGASIQVDMSMVKDLGLSLAIRAEEILGKLAVPHLCEQELLQIRDPLNARGEYTSVLTFNDHLATNLNATVNIKASDLKLLYELHMIVVSLTAIDGGGELRYTEALANLYSQPNQLDKRTMFWEAGRLIVHYEGLWTKSEGQSGKASRKIKSTVIRTCSPRTSSIFLRCALWTKPAEARLVSLQFGDQAGAVHMKAFAARDGKDMGCQSNSAWARAYFNRKSVICCKLQLHDMRHVLIGITKKITRSLAEKESGKMILAFEEAGARMSNHSLDTEDGRYGGEAHIAGIEGPDREVYKKISDAFNRKVFGPEFGYKLEALSTSSSLISTSLPLLSATSAVASAAQTPIMGRTPSASCSFSTCASVPSSPAFTPNAFQSPSAFASPPLPSGTQGDQPSTSFPSYLDARLPVSASAPAQISVAASAQQASKSNHHPNQPSSS
jgi:hypothetical protein